MIAVTIADASDLAHARVLARSFRDHHPAARCVIVRADAVASTDEELPADALPDVDVLRVAAWHGPDGVRAALVPHAARHLATDGQVVVVLSPTSRVVGTLDSLEDVAGVALYAPAGRLDPGVIVWRAGAVADAVAAAWPEVLDPAAGGDFESSLRDLAIRVSGVEIVRQSLPVLRLDELEPAAAAAGRPADAVPAGRVSPECLERHLAELAAEPAAGARPWTHLRPDLPYGPVLRRLYREAADRLPSPFAPDGLQQFLVYAREPAPEGAEAGVTRAVHALWVMRPELRAAYPQLDGPDGPGLVDWVAVHGADHLPPVLHATPSPAVRAMLAAGWEGERAAPPLGVNVAGFLGSGLGLGEAGRLVLTALDAARVPALPVRARLAPAGAKADAQIATAGPDEAAFPLNLLCMTGESVAPFAREVGHSFFEGRLSIGLWFWELASPPPESWTDGFKIVDEVWATSAFVQDALAAVSPVPVVRVPLPIAPRPVERRSREELGLPEGRLFLYVYDLHSVEARKNPSGLARAFAEAFEPGSGNVLILKSANADRVPDRHARVVAAAGGHPDIHLIDRWVTAAERDAMIAACDCYVSPHRAEGFGLTIAEAMSFGRPVIATGYGGNADFTTEETAYVLPWSLRSVGPGAHPYPAEAQWADPDHDALVAALRRVADHPEEASARGQRAREHVLRHHAPAVAGAAMRARLEELHARVLANGASVIRPTRAAALQPDAYAPPPPETSELVPGGDAAALERLRTRAAVSARYVEGALRTFDHRVGRRVERAAAALDGRLRDLAAELDRRRARDRAELMAEVRRLRARLDELEADGRSRAERR